MQKPGAILQELLGACSNISSGYFGYDHNGDYEREQISLKHCFQLSHTIPGKIELFCSNLTTVQVIFYSLSDTSRKER